MKKINLIDINPAMLNAWNRYFYDMKRMNLHDINSVVEVSVIGGDFFSVAADAVVSPGNSFGFMDGGLDAYITEKFGSHLQDSLQNKIKELYNGELLVGQAITLETNNETFPYCIAAPTMRVPMILSDDTVNPYIASKAAFNVLRKNDNINSINISGFGTGVGRVDVDICAKQMYAACMDVFYYRNSFPHSWYDAQIAHQKLYNNKEIKDLQQL